MVNSDEKRRLGATLYHPQRRKGSGYPGQDLRQGALASAVKLPVNPHVIRVQDMPRKWGSCTSPEKTRR